MATEATVTIRVSTSEWDLIRAALQHTMSDCAAENKNMDNDASVRAANRERAGRYSDLIRRLS